MRRYRRRRRQLKEKRLVHRLARSSTLERADLLYASALRSFGGIDGFGAALDRLWNEAGRTRDGLRLRWGIFGLTMRLAQFADANLQRSEMPSDRYADWSEDELQRELDRQEAALLRKIDLAENSGTGT
jgi:hypothetical protein